MTKQFTAASILLLEERGKCRQVMTCAAFGIVEGRRRSIKTALVQMRDHFS
jgi:hypothetical protein